MFCIKYVVAELVSPILLPLSKNGNSPKIGVFISLVIITMLTPKIESIINISILVFFNLLVINPMPKLPINPPNA